MELKAIQKYQKLLMKVTYKLNQHSAFLKDFFSRYSVPKRDNFSKIDSMMPRRHNFLVVVRAKWKEYIYQSERERIGKISYSKYWKIGEKIP